jgi:hypothetical protein
MAFAPGQESKFIATMSGEPDWSLVYWDWELPKVQAIIRIGLATNCLSFNSLDYTKGITLSGGEMFQWYKITDGVPVLEKSQLSGRTSGEKYVTHEWTSTGNIVVATARNDILVLDQHCETVYTFQSHIEVTSILTFSRGMVIGGTDASMEMYGLNHEL